MKRAAIAALVLLAGCATTAPIDRQDLGPKRAAMVAQIREAMIRADPKVDDAFLVRALASVSAVPREAFVVPAARTIAYLDVPLVIGFGQTISAPHIVTLMTVAAHVSPDDTVLDVGTGSGYQAAVLSRLVRHVTSVEIVPELASQAARRLAYLGYRNVEVHAADGFAGWPAAAPFDAIIVAAGAARVPSALIGELTIGGRLVMPIGPSTAKEQLLVITKTADGSITRCSLGPTMFVPLTGKGQRADQMHGLIDRSIPLCYAAPLT